MVFSQLSSCYNIYMEKSQEIIDRIIDLEKSIESIEKKFTVKYMFWMGLVKGAAALMGAIILIIFGGWFLRTIGVIPGLEEISITILEAAEKARLR